MPARYDITHTTTYRYHEPVSFGLHRLMFRPRGSHDLRVLATDLQVSPDAIIRMVHDTHSNSIALVQPLVKADRLEFICTFSIERITTPSETLALDEPAYIPFEYSEEDQLDLGPYLRPHYEDPQGELTRWARQFLHEQTSAPMREVLARMNAHIGQHLRYVMRDEKGTHTPLDTLASGSGSCRDYALLMMEAARRLGIATRFVSGYLYDTALDPAANDDASESSEQSILGAGSTHAWLEAYLPGPGWVEFDPTNNLVGSNRLIRVGVTRDPALAAPVSGHWFGPASVYAGLEVAVQIRRIGR